MTETTNVLAFRQPSAVDDPLTDIVRAGARDLLARAIEIEVGAFLASTANLTLPDGRARLVRHGHGPVREIATGIGKVIAGVKFIDGIEVIPNTESHAA
ncbi:hypothetical protein ABIE86_000059 [Bradyrhizobium diazoefficiens]